MSPAPREPGKLVLVSAGLHRRGGGVAVVGRLSARALAEVCEREGRVFEALDLGPPEELGVPNVTSFSGDQKKLARRIGWLQWRGGISGLIFDHIGPARIQAWLPRSLRAPYAVWLHGIEVWRPLPGDRRRALSNAQLLLANSRFTWQRAVEFNPWLAGRPHAVVHLAVEGPAPLVEVKREEATDELGRPPYLLMLGRLSASERYKGHSDTIEAFSRIASEFPGTQLVIAGDGDDRQRLEGLARGSMGSAAIRFVGFVDEAEKEALIVGCRALVMPSEGEGFGLVFIEALRFGRPIVACSGTVAEEVADRSGCAFLVPPKDASALSAALRTALARADLCLGMGQAGRKLVSQTYTESAFRIRLDRELRIHYIVGRRPGEG